MTSPSVAPARIHFDDFEVDVRTGELSRSGRKLRLPNQSFRVLAMLLERPGQLVTREELRASLWPSGTFVEYDQGLNAAVNRLREALRDSADKPRFIETLPRRGYRFIGTIEVQSASGVPSGALVSNTPPVQDVAHEGVRIGLLAIAGSLVALLVIAGTILSMSHRSAPGPPAHRDVVPFTSLPGQALAPTFSPDGSHIAFAWNGGNDDRRGFDLYVKEIGSERLLRLTNHPSDGIIPAWSPDGSSIAFVRFEDRAQEAGIFIIPALGGVERRVLSTGVVVGHLIHISWSPDGKRIAYPAYGYNGTPQIYLLSVDTLQTQPLSPAPECLDALQPAFSPDGTELALVCTSSSEVYTIYAVDIAHASLRRLASMMGDPQGLVWLADGSRIVFSNDAGRGGELWEVTLQGGLSELPFGEDGTAPAIAARGSRIAYVRGRNTTDIWRADLTAPRPEDSATNLIYSTRAQLNPRYSEDGTHIVFQSNRSGNTEIWLADGDGADPVRLTSFNGPSTEMPSWCSDGRRIAFDSSASGASAIYVEDIAERVPRKLATSANNLSRPVWSRDCRWIFASDGKYRLYRIPSSGGAAERFTSRPAFYVMPIADRILFNVADATGVVLWSKLLGGGPESPIEQMPKLSYGNAWTANSTGIYYTDTSLGQPTLYRYDFASRTTRRIMGLKQSPVPGAGFGIALSSDGRWLLYTQYDNLESEIMLGPSP